MTKQWHAWKSTGKTEKLWKQMTQMTIAILPSIVAAMMQNKARYHFAICDQAHAKHDQVGASFEFSSALITRQRTRRSRPRQIQLRRRSGPVDRLSPERVELAGKSLSRASSGQAGFESTISCSAKIENLDDYHSLGRLPR